MDRFPPAPAAPDSRCPSLSTTRASVYGGNRANPINRAWYTRGPLRGSLAVSCGRWSAATAVAAPPLDPSGLGAAVIVHQRRGDFMRLIGAPGRLEASAKSVFFHFKHLVNKRKGLKRKLIWPHFPFASHHCANVAASAECAQFLINLVSRFQNVQPAVSFVVGSLFVGIRFVLNYLKKL